MKREEAIDLIATTFDATEEAAEDVIDTLAMRANIAWDPEEPEVAILWSRGPYRLLSNGQWQYWTTSTGSEWVDFTPDGQSRHVFEELARRLLEEHKQQEALDDHNDKQEQETNDRAIWSTLNEHQDRLDAFEGAIRTAVNWRKLFDTKLTKVEEDLLLVRGQAAHVDEREAADFEATRIHPDGLDERVEALEARPTLGKAGDLPGDPAQVAMHYEEWKKLVAVYELWGPEGSLRSKLVSLHVPEYNYSKWFTQLRSELLALPVEEFPL